MCVFVCESVTVRLIDVWLEIIVIRMVNVCDEVLLLTAILALQKRHQACQRVMEILAIVSSEQCFLEAHDRVSECVAPNHVNCEMAILAHGVVVWYSYVPISC